ncbi:MAG: nitrilase/cyanide hydratase and apolipoprotein N-acyltransferase [Limisphaerales bacterium]|nr:MAG: nitrilase/cyanide hydratase and apolipoprotein N-acyltransferase [Limisphaerales bacterium]KAG0506856.1 MAG: nitrilase/cyanide hydratase and apolipoprotein N-acyltransferase [Limisphaerales bacterium]TXT49853.1 MAG: nitrilase/cyanide hydratase and apolipoprotein N-acyltransferase [Limisphaerales bacterium]
MRQSFNLALAQMLVTPGEVAGNLARAEARIATAAAQGADIVLLPEALDCGWSHPSAREFAGEIPHGDACRRLCAAAKQHGVFVCAGLVERAGDRWFNAAVLVDPRGEVILHHRKISELDFARELYSVGDRLGVAETPWGRAGLMICADGFAPGQVISRSLALMGARFILSPCAWAVPADHDNTREPYGRLWLDNYGPVARDLGVWIAGCSNVGPVTAGEWAGRKCIGNSLVCAPERLVAARGAYGESADEIVLVRVELA